MTQCFAFYERFREEWRAKIYGGTEKVNLRREEREREKERRDKILVLKPSGDKMLAVSNALSR